MGLVKPSSHHQLTSLSSLFLVDGLNTPSGFQLYLGEITEQNRVGVPQPGHERGVGHQFLMVESVAWSTELVNGLNETRGLSITLKHQKWQRESNKTALKRSEK